MSVNPNILPNSAVFILQFVLLMYPISNPYHVEDSSCETPKVADALMAEFKDVWGSVSTLPLNEKQQTS